jgi:hypothetical protein
MFLNAGNGWDSLLLFVFLEVFGEVGFYFRFFSAGVQLSLPHAKPVCPAWSCTPDDGTVFLRSRFKK